MVYVPSLAVTAVRIFSMRTGLAASTVTPGNTAPLVSRTVPAIPLCASTTCGTSTATSTTNPLTHTPCLLIMSLAPLEITENY
jgi:hypothetical protein